MWSSSLHIKVFVVDIKLNIPLTKNHQLRTKSDVIQLSLGDKASHIWIVDNSDFNNDEIGRWLKDDLDSEVKNGFR